MDRMQPPERRIAVAEIMHHHEGEIGNEERDQHLRPHRPLRRPKTLKREQPADHRDQQHAVDARHFVGQRRAAHWSACRRARRCRSTHRRRVRCARPRMPLHRRAPAAARARNTNARTTSRYDPIGRAGQAEHHKGGVAVTDDLTQNCHALFLQDLYIALSSRPPST